MPSLDTSKARLNISQKAHTKLDYEICENSCFLPDHDQGILKPVPDAVVPKVFTAVPESEHSEISHFEIRTQ